MTDLLAQAIHAISKLNAEIARTAQALDTLDASKPIRIESEHAGFRISDFFDNQHLEQIEQSFKERLRDMLKLKLDRLNYEAERVIQSIEIKKSEVTPPASKK